jgi:hypothetical protein
MHLPTAIPMTVEPAVQLIALIVSVALAGSIADFPAGKIDAALQRHHISERSLTGAVFFGGDRQRLA